MTPCACIYAYVRSVPASSTYNASTALCIIYFPFALHDRANSEVTSPPSHSPPNIDVDHSNFNEELPRLVTKIEEILPNGDSKKIDEVLERLKVGNNTPTNTRFSYYSAFQTYNGLNNVQQKIVQNFKDALTLRALLPPDDYLTNVVLESHLDGGAFGNVYSGKWNEEKVAVKKFGSVNPPVFLIPSDIIRCPILNDLQAHIEGSFKVLN
jgi:hypothetical protein